MKKDDVSNPSGDVNVGTYDRFSETQTESQVSALTFCFVVIVCLHY